MKKDLFIHENGETLTPHPIYAREIDHSRATPGILKSAEIPTPTLTDVETGEKLFKLFIPALKKRLS
jgi:hypothetical protein